jgi:hypothetical protein
LVLAPPPLKLLKKNVFTPKYFGTPPPPLLTVYLIVSRYKTLFYYDCTSVGLSSIRIYN